VMESSRRVSGPPPNRSETDCGLLSGAVSLMHSIGSACERAKVECIGFDAISKTNVSRK
jgi:hypothetical protein